MLIDRGLRAGLDHRWARRRMSEYIDEELPPRQRRRLERHTDICPECRRMLGTLVAVVRALRTLRDDGGSAVASSIVARTQGEVIGRGARQSKL